MPTKEASLADLLPLWCTVRELDTTVLVTPALDYCGALELGPLDARYASADNIEATGERLRGFIGALEDGCVLHFLYRVSMDGSVAIDDYEAAHSTQDPTLKEFVAGRAAWLRRQPLRQVRVFLFFALKKLSLNPLDALQRGTLGARLPFLSTESLAKAQHEERVRGVAKLRNRIVSQLGQCGVWARELTVDEVREVHFQLLNPNHAERRQKGPKVTVQDTLWHESMISRYGAHLRELTEAEQLLFEELHEERGHFRQEGLLRRALTLKVLPEGSTPYFSAERFLALQDGDQPPFAYWLSVAIEVHSQGAKRWQLDKANTLVELLNNVLPFLSNRSASRDAADASQSANIKSLFAELNQMASKIVALSVTLLLDGKSLEQLDARTEVARSAFRNLGQCELLQEETTQLPAFLSMMPGAGAYQLRQKTCTSRNAGDFLPLLAPWRGGTKAVSLYTSPTGDPFRFDPFDHTLANAHHGLVVASTGSGKSVALGSMTLDALASGVDAILIDNGRSWEGLTKLCGGKHLVVDIKTPLAPFRCWKEMEDPNHKGKLDLENVQETVGFLEMCIQEEGEKGFNNLTLQLVSRAVAQVYARLRATPDSRPLMSAFRNEIAAEGKRSDHPDDKRIGENIARRLGLFVGDELYGTFLDRPSELRFDSRLLTFEMEGVAKSKLTRTIAMATIMTAITARAAQRNRPTLVEIDEGHSYLGAGDTSERFLGRCYRVMRKYSVAMWMITQQFVDFVQSSQGHAIIGNSIIKLFLTHRSNHQHVEEYFGFSARARAAFKGLEIRSGHHSDMLLMYADRMATLRLGLDPFAYWLLTTDPQDKKLKAIAAKKNPSLSPLELVRELARLYPHGTPKGVDLHAAA